MKKALGISVLAVFLAGLAASPGRSADNVLYGCVKKNNGQLRLVMNLRSCRPSEHAVSWNIAGPQGPQGPAGSQGPIGPQGPVGPQGDTGADAPVMQLAGFTTPVFNGATGVLNLSVACDNQFPASRICTSEEVLNTSAPPALPALWAWVRPSFGPLAAGSAGPSTVDSSGISGDPMQLTCGGWKETALFTGLAVDDSGAFDLVDCSAELPVACCAPVPATPAP